MNTTPEASYDAIAEWYDNFVRTEPLLYEVVIPETLRLVEETGSLADADICDLACGQGVIARALALRGARVTGVDISEKLLSLARSRPVTATHAITWRYDDAQVGRTLATAAFDGVVCNMALMDIADLAAALQTVSRILRPGGWFVFALTHPCVQMPDSAWMTRPDGETIRGSGDYFAEGFWRPAGAPGVRGRVGAHHHTLSTYFNALIDAGLIVERVAEPVATESLVQRVPGYRSLPPAFLARCRKPGESW
jgi:2-polyprenyl-3-methyl-5-hydroxy-6-metoxy-1,4-benzoquinol methylase